MTTPPNTKRRDVHKASETRPERYDEWLEFICGRIAEDTDPHSLDWHFDASAQEIADLCIATMKYSGVDLKRYTDFQLAVGLQAILFNHLSDVPGQLSCDDTTDSQKLEFIRSITFLYRDCLSARSPRVLSHQNYNNINPLEYVTYMLWDASPITSMIGKKQPERRDAFLNMLESALYSTNPACVESALHGLGHSRIFGFGTAPYNERIDNIIDRFLESRSDIEPALEDYAKAARTGMIQ